MIKARKKVILTLAAAFAVMLFLMMVNLGGTAAADVIKPHNPPEALTLELTMEDGVLKASATPVAGYTYQYWIISKHSVQV